MQLHQIMFAWAIAMTTLLLVNAQLGPFPPRLTIPGAVQLGAPIPLRPQFRNEKLVRVRRPTALRNQAPIISPVTPRIFDDPKPVTESAEEEGPDVFLPSLLREQQIHQAQQAQFQQMAASFFNEPNTIQDAPNIPSFIQQEEPLSLPIPVQPRFPERQTVNSLTRPQSFGGGQRFGLERSQPQPQLPVQSQPEPQQPSQRTNVVRSRPVAQTREPKPQFKSQLSTSPIQNHLNDERTSQPRRQRPVAQTIRKWNEENEDGSITWGYENDDGSFKEEIIGTDCITRGTYGYIDPDGNKREYHYETGIKCDPNTRETEEEIQDAGFVNYEENKAVLPNGIEIDMNQLGKKKSRRPAAIYRN